MSIAESERLHLFQAAKKSFGDEGANTLMDMLPPTGWSDVATKQDVSALRTELRGELAVLRAEFREEMERMARKITFSIIASFIPIMLTGIGLSFVAAHFGN